MLLHYRKPINDTETEFIWRTLLNICQGTANPKQNVCPGETQIRLRSLNSLISVFAEEVMGSWLAYSG